MEEGGGGGGGCKSRWRLFAFRFSFVNSPSRRIDPRIIKRRRILLFHLRLPYLALALAGQQSCFSLNSYSTIYSTGTSCIYRPSLYHHDHLSFSFNLLFVSCHCFCLGSYHIIPLLLPPSDPCDLRLAGLSPVFPYRSRGYSPGPH